MKNEPSVRFRFYLEMGNPLSVVVALSAIGILPSNGTPNLSLSFFPPPDLNKSIL